MHLQNCRSTFHASFDMQKSIRLRYNSYASSPPLSFESLIFILCRVIFKLINCVPANYQEEPLSRGQRPVKIYVLSILNYILMYARPVCLIFSRTSSQHTYISYNYKVLSISPPLSLPPLVLRFSFYKNRLSLHVAFIFRLHPIDINISARPLYHSVSN